MDRRSMLAVLTFLVAGAAVLFAASPAAAQTVFLTPEQVEAEIGPSIPRIETAYAFGSGVLIGPRRVLTNAHVVRPFNSVTVTFPDGETFYQVPVVAWDLVADMVMLELPSDARAAPLTVVSESGLPIGTAVYSIGYPGQSDGTAPLTVMGGRINRFRTWPALGVTYVQTDIPVIGGMSGGAVISSAGGLIAFNQWGLDGNESVGPSAVRVIARLEDELAGADVDRLGTRYPEVEAPGDGAFEFSLLDGRDEKVFVSSADALGPVYLSLSASEAAWVGVVLLDGTVVVASSAEESADHVLEFTATGIGVPFYVVVDQRSDGAGQYSLGTSIDLMPLDDPDDRRVITKSQLVWGQNDYPLDRDTLVVPLEAGQTLSVEVESLLVDQFVAVERLENGQIELLDWDDDSGGGVWSLDPLLSFVAPDDGDYFLVIGGLFDPGVGGYIANIQITSPVSSIGGTFTGELPSTGIGLTSWGGGPIDDVISVATVLGCELESFWIAENGVLIGYLVGAPEFVNDQVGTLYSLGVPARTVMLVSCAA